MLEESNPHKVRVLPAPCSRTQQLDLQYSCTGLFMSSVLEFSPGICGAGWGVLPPGTPLLKLGPIGCHPIMACSSLPHLGSLLSTLLFRQSTQERFWEPQFPYSLLHFALQYSLLKNRLFFSLFLPQISPFSISIRLFVFLKKVSCFFFSNVTNICSL